MPTSDKLIQLYQQMSDHTKQECASCQLPHSCCDVLYCEIADAYARGKGIALQRSDHDPKLLFMSPGGCTVPPYLRPLCTVHTCAIAAFGEKPGDKPWTREYFKLRNAIHRAERKEMV